MSQRRYVRAVVLVVVLLGGLLAGPISGSAATGVTDQRHSYTGTIDGADFRVEVPHRWNGTLVLYSHGYYPPGGTPPEILLATRKETEEWLLDHGYAVAASNFRGVSGWLIEQGIHDQLALLDWFASNIGRPRRTIANGMSMGAGIAIQLAERNPHRFAGVVAQCSSLEPNGTFNTQLDIAFTVRTLLAPGQTIDLVRARDPEGSTHALLQAAEQALTTPQGRARLALAGAFGNIPDWGSAHQPRPTDLAERITQQAVWTAGAYIWGMGPSGRVDLERRAGGNPSWNIGIDYRRQLARSSQRDLVEEAYRAAGLDLGADLDLLAQAPRIAPDPRALAYMYRHTVVRGTTPSPVVTLHNTGDGGAIPDLERWYAEQVSRYGDPGLLRQLYVDRGSHCAFSAAEEITALRTLLRRIDTGRWPSTDPDRLNDVAADFDARYHLVLDLLTFHEAPMPPAFTRFTPPAFLRPSR
jgi:pimeloyl-ACP methyl ester carboxylesterase